MAQTTPDDDTDDEHIDRRQFMTRSAAVGAILGGLIWTPDNIDEFLGGPDPFWTVDDPELDVGDDVEDCEVSAERDGSTLVMDVTGRVSQSAVGDTLVIRLEDDTGLIPRKKTREITSQRFSHTLQIHKVNDFDRVWVRTQQS